MSCPSEIEHALLIILRLGILNARNSGWEGDAQRCALESDHIHNLPDLLSHFSPDSLRYYYEVERPLYAEKSPEGARLFEPYWETLEEFLSHQPAS
jgi:hypothetical protein